MSEVRISKATTYIILFLQLGGKKVASKTIRRFVPIKYVCFYKLCPQALKSKQFVLPFSLEQFIGQKSGAAHNTLCVFAI